MPPQLLLLELNEVNFEFIKKYIQLGKLPTFAGLLAKQALFETTSELAYEHLEPWIQWVTAHTGRTFAEHGVFRLGDIVSQDIPQIWEQLEEQGLLVGAISPMNAKHRLTRAAFFVPDPWTNTKLTACDTLRHLYSALVQAVNDNASSKITLESLFALAKGALKFARLQNYFSYASLVLGSRGRPWRKAMFLDLLLSDVFMHEVRRTSPNFASLFLNAGAHIQHHYMFSAEPYAGTSRNPEWYAEEGVDPVFEIYELYDRLIALIRASFPAAQIMLATGLHQEPHPRLTYYWRLRDHERFLRKLGVDFERVEPRMSRDFVVVCKDSDIAQSATTILQVAVAQDGIPLFEVDNRGQDLFVTLTYPNEIVRSSTYIVNGRRLGDLYDEVAFVAIKNGGHNGTGYFLDTAVARGHGGSLRFPLKELPTRIHAAFGLSPGPRPS